MMRGLLTTEKENKEICSLNIPLRNDINCTTYSYIAENKIVNSLKVIAINNIFLIRNSRHCIDEKYFLSESLTIVICSQEKVLSLK